MLIACPVNVVKQYCIDDFIAQLKKLTYPNLQFFLSDNSADKKFCEYINAQGIDCGWIDPKEKINMQYMAESHEQCRQEAIKRKVNYMLHWECDLFSDHTGIVEMMMMNKHLPVVGACYHIKHGKESHLCIVDILPHEEKEPISLAVLKDGADIAFVDGTVKKVFSVGLGFTLIREDVLSSIPFRWDVNQTHHPDSSFAEDLYYKKIPVNCDTKILLQHKNSEWLHYN